MTEQEKLAMVDVLGRNDEKRFYVYALFDPRPEFNRVFYIGKGEGERVWQHEKGMETELAEIGKKDVSLEEKELLTSALSEKYKTIKKIHDKGLEVQKIIIKWGLTEQEAFYAESALINIFNYPKRELTNKVSGHATEKERDSDSNITEAMTVDTFYRNNVKNPINFESLRTEIIGDKIIFVNIARAYLTNMPNDVIKDIGRGRWRVANELLNEDYINNKYYLFVISDSVIKGIYRITAAHSYSDTVDFPVVEEGYPYHSDRVNEKQRLENYSGDDDNWFKRIYFSVDNLNDEDIAHNVNYDGITNVKYKDLIDCRINKEDGSSIFYANNAPLQNPIRNNYN